jgi:hypothetical protein
MNAYTLDIINNYGFPQSWRINQALREEIANSIKTNYDVKNL